MYPGHDKPSTARSTGKVLVVDDEWSMRDLLSIILECEGIEVVSVENGQQALDYLKTHPSPVCIVLDYDMPEMNGDQFRKAQQCFPELNAIPVVLVTAALDIRRKADELQVKAYLKKPFDIDQLLEAVLSCFLQERAV